MDFQKKYAIIGGIALGAGIVIGVLAGLSSKSHTVLMSPTPDNKAEQAYRRSGFGDKLMTPQRRLQLSLCYKTMLNSNGYNENNPTPKPDALPDASNVAFEGKVTFIFNIAEDGKMIGYELVESEISDKSFQRCVQKAIKDARFLPPPLGINRYLAYDFVFKSDETFKKEMEERKNQSPLMLVTPTPSNGTAPAQTTESPTNTDAGAPPPPPPPPPSEPKTK